MVNVLQKSKTPKTAKHVVPSSPAAVVLLW